jgi:hypothetical protein
VSKTTTRLARVYAYAVLLLSLLLLIWSLLTHIYALCGYPGPYLVFGRGLVATSIAATFSSIPFCKDRIWWSRQIKLCPKWMWRSALGIGMYQLVLLTVKFFLLPSGDPIADKTLVFSAWPMAFFAISFCIVYSALFASNSIGIDLTKRARTSAICAAVCVCLFVANRAGYISHLQNALHATQQKDIN